MQAHAGARPEDAGSNRSARYTRALTALTRRIWHDDCTLDAALAGICATAAAALDVPRVNVWRYDAAEDRLVCLHAHSTGQDGPEPISELETLDLEGEYGTLLGEVRVIEAVDVRTHPGMSDSGLAAYFLRHGIFSLLDAPVRMQGHLVGVICHEQTDCPRPWAPEELTFAGSMGDFVSMALEIQRRRDAEQQLEHLRLHDTGTDLPNRQYFLELLQLRLRAPRASGRVVAVLHVRIELPYVTTQSSDGPTVEDAMAAVADSLRQRVGAECSIARVRANGFALLPQRQSSEHDAIEMGERCVDVVRELAPFAERVEIGAGVGVAFVNGADESDARGLLRRAEQAADRAASRGRYQFEIFDIEHHRGLLERLQLEQALRNALANEEFEVHYQPEVDSRTGAWCAAEALLRWRRDGRVVAAGEFIAVAEGCSLILPLGRWVLARACRDAMSWPIGADGQPLTLRVNVSARQLDDPGLVAKVAESLDRSGLPASRLCLEITETTLMREHTDVIAVMHQLKALGLTLAIDDFGTGYSSLSYLKRFPVDVLKIDRSFIEGLPELRIDAAIVAAVATLAHAIGIDVVGEGVETVAQQEALVRLGVTHLQGWLYAPALAQDDFLRSISLPPAAVPVTPPSLTS